MGWITVSLISNVQIISNEMNHIQFVYSGINYDSAHPSILRQQDVLPWKPSQHPELSHNSADRIIRFCAIASFLRLPTLLDLAPMLGHTGAIRNNPTGDRLVCRFHIWHPHYLKSFVVPWFLGFCFPGFLVSKIYPISISCVLEDIDPISENLLDGSSGFFGACLFQYFHFFEVHNFDIYKNKLFESAPGFFLKIVLRSPGVFKDK